MTELEALIVLNAIVGLTNTRIVKLIEYFGSAQNVLAASLESLISSQILSADVAGVVVSFPKDSFLRSEKALIEKNRLTVLSFSDEGFPLKLKEIPDSPIVLYVKGDVSVLNDLSVAIVGSRKASLYGISTANQIASRLAEYGFIIVSGLARGIDTAAHKGALQGKGKTIGVLGHGFSYVYPPENKELYEETASHGAIISEFAMDTPPIPFNFPRRNRIVSGLSMGVVVVEAAEKSGALITADFALEQGREVFAVPGKIDSLTSRGVNNLIRQGAKLVMGVEDILEELKGDVAASVRGGSQRVEDNAIPSQPQYVIPAGELSVDESFLLDQMSDIPIHFDELSQKCSAQIINVSSLLFKLELKKVIKQLPGKYFQRQFITTHK